MVSLARARECIGRPIKHVKVESVKGTLLRVSNVYLVIQTDHGEEVCHPDNMEWDVRPFAPIVGALRTGTDYEGVQAFVVHDDEVSNECIYIGTPAQSNDDDRDHWLYIGLPMMKRFHPVRPTADPWAAYFYEEVCGWAQP